MLLGLLGLDLRLICVFGLFEVVKLVLDLLRLFFEASDISVSFITSKLEPVSLTNLPRKHVVIC